MCIRSRAQLDQGGDSMLVVWNYVYNNVELVDKLGLWKTEKRSVQPQHTREMPRETRYITRLNLRLALNLERSIGCALGNAMLARQECA